MLELNPRRELEGAWATRTEESASGADRREEVALHRLRRLPVLRWLHGSNGDAAARIVRLARATDVRFIEDVEALADQAQSYSFTQRDHLLYPQIEGAEWAEVVDACRNVLQRASCKTRECRRAGRKGVPLVDDGVQLIAVLDVAANRVALQQR